MSLLFWCNDIAWCPHDAQLWPVVTAKQANMCCRLEYSHPMGEG